MAHVGKYFEYLFERDLGNWFSRSQTYWPKRWCVTKAGFGGMGVYWSNGVHKTEPGVVDYSTGTILWRLFPNLPAPNNTYWDFIWTLNAPHTDMITRNEGWNAGVLDWTTLTPGNQITCTTSFGYLGTPMLYLHPPTPASFPWGNTFACKWTD